MNIPSATSEIAASLLDRARKVGPTLAATAQAHDAEASFVKEAYDALAEAGLLKAAVPKELGGDGATVADLVALQRELGRHCGATALASAMHQHVTCFTAWRYRRGLPGAEATLRRVAEEGIVLVSTGGGDYTRPRGTAVRADGGYVVSGRKRFASQSAAGTVMSTMFVLDDPEAGPRVLNMSVPMNADGVRIVDNWDTLGMRGTASNDVIIENVFVPDDRVLANRPYGEIDPPLQVISIIAFPVIAGAYLGVAESAYEAAIAELSSNEIDLVHRRVGVMRQQLEVATWALNGALACIGDDPTPSHDTFLAVMSAKAEVVRAGMSVCDEAMSLAGGRSYFKGSTIERCVRDIRAAAFHPLTPEDTFVELGRNALGARGILE